MSENGHDLPSKLAKARQQLQTERVEAILNNSMDGILLVHTDLTIQQTNTSFNRLFACEQDDYFGKSLIALLHGEDTDRVTKTVQAAVAEHQANSIEIRTVRQDGTVFDAELSIGYVKDDGLVCTIRDITERKRAEEALIGKLDEERELQSYLRALHEITLELAQVDDLDEFYRRTVERGLQRLGIERLSLFLYDAATNTAIGTYGTDPQGKSVAEPDLRFVPAPDGIMGRAFAREERFCLDVNTRLSGSHEELLGTGWNAAAVLWNGTQSLGWLVADNLLSHTPPSKSVLDSLALYALSVGALLARKQTDAALRESEARYRLLAENVTDVITKITPDGIRTFITPSCYALLGYTPEELLGKSVFEFVHPEDRLQAVSTVLQAANSSKTSFILTQRLRHKAGHYIWVEVMSTIIRDPDTGIVVELMAVIRDISERKRAEEALDAKVEEEREFQGYLKVLHEITIELTQVDELDTFYERAVDLGLTRLGFERLALFLYDEKDGMAQGTYGTDPQGKLVDERHIRFIPDPNGIMQRAFGRDERFYFNENAPLYENMAAIGVGWNAATVLWNGTRSLGWFVADNLLHHTPASKPLLDILGLYALTVGTLLAQKQVQIALRESEARYRLLTNTVNDVVIRFSPELEYLYLSPSSRTVLGYEPEELLGPADYRHIHPDDGAAIQALIKRLVEHPGAAAITYRFLHKQGHYVWLECTGQTVVSEQTGKVVEFVFSARDITERKSAEEALRESEEKFRLLLDAAPVATVISDQRGRIILVNVQAETLFGFDRAELMGQMVEILVPEYARQVHVHKRTAYMGAPYVRHVGMGLELFARRKDGSELPVEIELSYIETQDGVMVMSFVVDITERKRDAAELERQRSFLRSVIDVSPSMIFVKDYDARFVLVNPMVAKMYNTSVEALIGKTDADFDPSQKEIDDFLEADRRVIASGEPLFIEEPITNFAGETHWLQTTKVPIISVDGKSKHVLGVATDITERKQAEAALKESEEKYRSLVETMRGGLAIFDLDNRITYINDRFCELLGYSREEVMGTRAADYVDAPNLPALEAQLERRRHSESSAYELLFRHKNGDPVYMLVSASPLLDKNGNYTGSFTVTTDITVQKQAEEALRQALAKEQELGELKSRFVSMASHEFRTPLATILALTETLSAYRHKLSEDQIDQRFDKIKAQVGHLKDIMEDVLLLARMQARRVDFNPVKLDLDGLCRSVLDEFQSHTDNTHLIEYSGDMALRKVTLDRKLMRQILSNLVSNAIKYSPEAKSVKVSLESARGSLVLKVSDEGIGIPEADLQHLFEPFHRAANVGAISGTGLGLVITKESVDLQGGTITVDSQIDVGTTFTVRIPITTMGDNSDDENPGH